MKNKKHIMRSIILFVVAIVAASVANSLVHVFFNNDETKPTSELMQQVASEINKKLPIIVDPDTRLDSVVGIGNKLIYNYTLVNLNASNLKDVSLNNELGDKIKSSVCSSPDMKIFVDNKTELDYSYYDKNGSFIETIVINTGADCK